MGSILAPVTKKELEEYSKITHFSREEVKALIKKFKSARGCRKVKTESGEELYYVDEPSFRAVVGSMIRGWKEDSIFMDRLFAIFDMNSDKTVDVREFIMGMSIFKKGTIDEKLKMTFMIYDLDGNGKITRAEMKEMLTAMYHTFYNDSNEFEIEQIVDRVFDTLDVNGDGQISYDEYKLAMLKEPMIANCIEQCLYA